MPLFYYLLAIVFLSPLPYGANREWSWSLWSLLIGIIGVGWSLNFLKNPYKTPFFSNYKSFLDIFILFSSVILWAFLQTLPFVPNEWKNAIWISSHTFHFNFNGSISLNSTDTLTGIMKLLSYGIVFWLSLCYCTTYKYAKIVFYGLMITGVLYASYGLIIYFTDSNKILWQTVYKLNGVNSTFINHNHFATFAGLTLLCTVALLNEAIVNFIESSKPKNMIYFLESTGYFLISFIIISSSVVLTNSRGGFLSTLIALIILLIALNAQRDKTHSSMLWIMIGAIGMGNTIFFITGNSLFERLNTQGLTDLLREESYLLVWKNSLIHQWQGVGLNCFEEGFMQFKTFTIAGTITQPILWNYAHNVYLETLFELGLPCTLALIYIFLKLIGCCYQGILMRKKNWLYSATGFAATCLIAIHSLVDFSLQIPAIAYTYTLLMGAACAQSFSSKIKKVRDSTT